MLAQMHQCRLRVVQLQGDAAILEGDVLDVINRATFKSAFPVDQGDTTREFENIVERSPRLVGKACQHFISAHGIFVDAPLDFVCNIRFCQVFGGN